ncbi:MAG: hypothetical protein KFW21_03485 [Spirochaetota bacterium]|nr:hypothetical protein [Spirochaetota bacterium]
MFIYKLIGILLISSPITVMTEYSYFPYSYLGLTLYSIVRLFSYKGYPPVVDLLLWGFCSLCIFIQKPISYQIGLALFMIYNYMIIYISSKFTIIPLLIFLGIILSFFTLIFTLKMPILPIINSLLLGIIMIVNHKKNNHKQLDLVINPQKSEYSTTIDTLIPLQSSNNLIQEQEYVIPLTKK